jgi:D-arabinose 1-dehydrogenase-like Zn-dependent alcohol dehydrogenase
VLAVEAVAGVGIHIVQIAQVSGARAIAVDLSAEKLAWGRAMGADEVVKSFGIEPTSFQYLNTHSLGVTFY